MTGRLVIVGGGIAGQGLAEGVRALDPDREILILSEEERAPSDRVRLSALLAEGGDPESLRLRPDSWYRGHSVELFTGARVARIDREAKVVETAAGGAIPYRTLALATGSSPVVPPIPGIDQAGVHVFRTPEDCEAILAAGRAARQACVLGGGLLGLEAARGLVAQGVPTTVVHLTDTLMEQQLDAAAGALLVERMRALGVPVLLERVTQAVVGDGDVRALRFAGGEQVPCDLLVVSVGIRPNAGLAREAGIDCSRGVVVDDHLRTSDPDVFAVGECAEHRGTVHGLVAPIHDQVKVAARAIAGAGAGAGYRGSVPSATLKVMGVDLVSVGDPLAPGGCTVHDPERGVYRRLAVRDGRPVGAILMGDVRGAESLVSLVAGGAALDDPLVALIEAARATGADLPEGTQVCACHGVSKAEIVQAIRDRGLKAPSEVTACTRAGSGCGGCKPLVGEIVTAETGGGAAEPAYLCPCRQLTREQVARAVAERGLRAASEVTEACGAGRDCGACKPGIAYLVSLLNANRHEEERGARFINDRVHANIQRDGTFSVVPRIYGGVTTPEELKRIASVAERHGVPMVKITGGQRIDLLGVRKEQLPAIWADLGMPSGFAYAKAVRTVKTCVGTDFCRFGIGDAIGLGIAMERAWEGIHTPHKVKSAVSGCPRNCAEALVKDIGVTAVEGGWEVVVGGAAGSGVRRADVLGQVETADAALALASTFLQYYREHAEYLERTYTFVERVGIEAIRAVVLDEASGEPERLRERLALARAAARDPWAEAASGPSAAGYSDLGEDPEPALVGPPREGRIGAAAS